MPPAGGKRVGSGSHLSRAHNTPAVASFEADVLCLYTAATVVSSLCLLFPHARPPACRDTLHPTLGTPKAKFASNCQHSWPGSGTRLSSARTRLTCPTGERQTPTAEAQKGFSSWPKEDATLLLGLGISQSHIPLCKPSLPTLQVTWPGSEG